ncbi:hypothetical protein [Streptomyces acidiscabies]|uniref:hypothetical protein n=1 Tax=Streptomyces acidiscabies TaxID=42234 RepID=UPI000B208805|nr:hypothetical protein [Streptomyces acidiscabies]
MRSGIRRLSGVFVVGSVLFSLSGCVVPSDAVAGVSVGADGKLVGVMLVCGHHIDGATLYIDSEEAVKERKVGMWIADQPLGPGLVTWPLETPAAGWGGKGLSAPLADGVNYLFYGWTKDNSWSATSVSFSLRDRILPGQVRYEGEDSSAITASLEEFEATACQ